MESSRIDLVGPFLSFFRNFYNTVSLSYFSGQNHHHFHGANESQHVCKCFEDNQCPLTGCKCNSFGSSQDSGIIRTRDLPIKSFSYGPLSTDEGSEMKVQIGDLKCSGTSPPVCKLLSFIHRIY